MGLTYHFNFCAPAGTSPDHLEEFLLGVEGDARLMGFGPTTVVNGPFDTPERRDFAKRVARGLVVEDARLRDADLPRDTCWCYEPKTGCCRLAPEHGVVLVVTDASGCETVFGFFRYPREVRDRTGAVIAPAPGGGAWVSGSCIKSPDQRYRALARRFAAAGYLESELDEFAAAPRA